MQVPTQVFKAYDIRGLVDGEITPEFAHALGRAFASLLIGEKNTRDLIVVVGRDMRESSPTLQTELMKGLCRLGITVVDIGLVSTPAFYFGVGDQKADGGIMISASHNPAAYNGFKMTRHNAIPVGGESGIMDLRQTMEDESFTSDAEVPGEVQSSSNIVEDSARAELAFAGSVTLPAYKVVADSGNGMGAQYLDVLFNETVLQPSRLYWELDGTFPNHDPDPLKEETLEVLKAKVLSDKADLGIATDGDGDRIFFVDNEGEVVPPAILRGLIAKILLRSHAGATMCYDVRPGKITEDMILESGGVPVKTRVGHSLIKEKMREVGSIFGGESSGHFFFAFPNGVFEGPVAMAVLLMGEMAKEGKNLADLVRPYKTYFHSGEINFKVPSTKEALEAVKEKYADGDVSELDGITVTYSDVWFNVRGSNTEPLVRLNLEARTEAVMKEKRDEVALLLEGLA